MKLLRILVFAAPLASCAALLPASASAAELACGVSMCAAGTTLKAESEGKAVLDAPFGNVECNSTLEGHTENAGSATETVNVSITSLTFSSCNSGNTVNVIKSGRFEIHTEGAENNNNGTLTSSGAEIEVTHLGVQCIYTTSSTTIGTVTGSETTGGNATLDIAGTLPRTGGSGGAFCGSSAPWTGSYKVTSPSTLNVDGFSLQEGLGGGSNAAPNVSDCFQGGPVNCATGNQTEEQTDLVLGGRGPALHLTRTYNSKAAAEAKEAGPWGY
ncbi:MAG: DUF6531 domain-containing protein, partial [Solirubrobacterales bacterium]